MAKTINLKKGFALKIKGQPANTVNNSFISSTFAVKPTDVNGISPIPKVIPEVGDEVLAGDPILYDKRMPEIKFCAPVSGEVVEIKRGLKRSISEVVILADKTIKFKDFGILDPAQASREQIMQHMLDSGAWTLLRQRPFNVIADPNEAPRDIFISCFSTAPLAVDYDFALQGLEVPFQLGIDALSRLTTGKVHLSVDGSKEVSPVFANTKNAELHKFTGKHPAGNVGVQIHHIKPIAKGDVVWTLNPQDVVAIGRLFGLGKFDTERLIAVGGPDLAQPQYIRTFIGANVANMLNNNLNSDNQRVISGDVLTGTKIDAKAGHIGLYHDQVSVIPEGDEYEFLGWLIPSYARPSISRTFLSFLRPNKAYEVNTNTHGEQRAMVVTGAMSDVVPMDILPMQLIKSILYRDFDLMEGLGIYEVVEEDLALAEFVDASKTNVQEILRDGLDYMREQA